MLTFSFCSLNRLTELFNHEGKQKLSNWRSIGSKRPDEGMKVRDSLEFLLRRLVRGSLLISIILIHNSLTVSTCF